MKIVRYIVLGIIVSSIFVCGCGDANNIGNYEKLIQVIKQGFSDGFETVTTEEIGISYVFNYRSETQGYCYMDLDYDGINELLLGENGEGAWDNVIYDIFTMKDGKLIHVIGGGERERYYLIDKEAGVLANEGSGGAANSFFGYYNYRFSGLELIEAVIYDSWKNEENPWFYSKDNVSAEDAASINEEMAMEIISSYKYKEIEFTPFLE